MIQKSLTVFKEFSKNPIVAMLFIALIAVGYLYWDVQGAYEDQIKEQKQTIKQLRNDASHCRDGYEDHLRSCEGGYDMVQRKNRKR